jgi:hypothetical protein
MAKMTLKDLLNVLITKTVEKRVLAFENDFGSIDLSKIKTFLKQLNSLGLLEDVEDYTKQAKEIVGYIERGRMEKEMDNQK